MLDRFRHSINIQMIAKLVHYSGRVQGVGFRFTAQRVASAHRVAGWVRNLPNGDVELLAQGEADEVERFLGALARQMAAYIVEQRTTDEAPQDLSTFTIRT